MFIDEIIQKHTDKHELPRMTFEEFAQVVKRVIIVYGIKPDDKLSVDEILALMNDYLKSTFGKLEEWRVI